MKVSLGQRKKYTGQIGRQQGSTGVGGDKTGWSEYDQSTYAYVHKCPDGSHMC